MRSLILAVILLAALLLAAGCTTTPPSNATVTPARTTAVPNVTTVQPAVYTAADSEKTVPLGLQQTMGIRLPDNPTTGFAWDATVTDGLLITDTAYTPDAQATGMVGVGSTRNWTVKGVKAGTQRFGAVYVRSFEPNLSADQLTLTVQVG